MKTFQKPLSKEEEEWYIGQLSQGNTQESETAKQILVERNLRLVAHIAKKYQNSDVDIDDLISIGTIGLIKAVISYDSTKNSKLGTYAARCIDNELLMMFRARKKTSKEISLYEPIGTDREGNEISLLDVIETEQLDIVEKMELEKNISLLPDTIKKSLTKREQEIILLRFGLMDGEELTQREIGQRLGLSRSFISRIEKKAIEKLRVAYSP
ncbi:MAG: RNA polymerase sporulation sigma factor SigK [Eubacteriales bacterium]